MPKASGEERHGHDSLEKVLSVMVDQMRLQQEEMKLHMQLQQEQTTRLQAQQEQMQAQWQAQQEQMQVQSQALQEQMQMQLQAQQEQMKTLVTALTSHQGVTVQDASKDQYDQLSKDVQRFVSDEETGTGSAEKVRTVKPRAPKKDFITTVYHEDVVGEALQEQKKSSSSAVAVVPKPSPKLQQGESDVRSLLARSPVVDNRTAWAQNIITKRSIKSLAREFTANKKIKPVDFTTEAYERNDAKNRYNDIICIDATRVVLKDRLPEDDYIHASWMTMPDGQKYICTQGPLLECVGDFWHMILTERSKVIVMLCNFNEGKHEKCCLYLPKEKKEVGNFGGFIVEVRDCKPDPFEGIKHTELDVKSGDDDGKGFIVHHLANFEWPDHTAPLNPAPTIGMFKLSRTLAAGKPITVHCSAGIGRSATFVAIDYAAQKIKAKADFSMVDVIRDLRSQRYQAIQSAIQYVYLHVCLLELFASDNALQRDSKFSEYMDSYVSMIKRYNKKVEAKQRERSRSEEK